MRILNVALILCLALFCTAFAEEGEGMEGSAKITVPAAIKHIDAYTAATVFVKAADYAPEDGWGDKDHSKAFQTMVTKGFETLAGWLNDERKPAGAFFAVWFDDPSETKAGDLTCKVGVPITGDHDPTVDVVIEDMPAGDVASLTYMGDYMGASNAWNDLMKFVEAEGYTYAGAPMEIYLVSQGQTENPEEWVTEIQWPVVKADQMKKEMMEEPANAEE